MALGKLYKPNSVWRRWHILSLANHSLSGLTFTQSTITEPSELREQDEQVFYCTAPLTDGQVFFFLLFCFLAANKTNKLRGQIFMEQQRLGIHTQRSQWLINVSAGLMMRCAIHLPPKSKKPNTENKLREMALPRKFLLTLQDRSLMSAYEWPKGYRKL